MPIRYFYVPYVMTCWALVICIGHRSLWRKWVATAFLVIIALSAVTCWFRAPPLVDLNWKSYASQISGGDALTIPLNPDGWSMSLDRTRAP